MSTQHDKQSPSPRPDPPAQGPRPRTDADRALASVLPDVDPSKLDSPYDDVGEPVQHEPCPGQLELGDVSDSQKKRDSLRAECDRSYHATCKALYGIMPATDYIAQVRTEHVAAERAAALSVMLAGRAIVIDRRVLVEPK